MMPGITSQIIFAPLVGALAVALVPRRLDRIVFLVGVLATAVTFGLTLQLFARFAPDVDGFQFTEIVPWIGSYGVTYFVGVDGISLVLVMLTGMLSLVALFSSWASVTQRRKEFVISILALESAMLGTFAALDAFLFYVFWEAMLVPMYLLIGVFGGPRRIYATLKFFLFTMVGSVFMLVALITLYILHAKQAGAPSTAIPDLYKTIIPIQTQLWMFAAFALAFAIKLPLFPFHTWLPDAHVEAPTAGSVILAGVLLKMGGYGLLRLAIPLFPDAARTMAPYLGLLGVIGIVYGAYVALAQEDMKKLVAYSSVSHMGFVALGLASLSTIGMGGAVFQMIAHGLSTGALFLLVGMLYERRHTRMLADFGGLAKVTPRLAVAFFVVTMASIGLPGLCGFVGEFMILSGSFRSWGLGSPAWLVGFATLGIVLGAAYMLMLYERVFLGTVRCEENRGLQDLKWNEMLTLAMPIILAIWLGLQPNIILSRIRLPIEGLAKRVSVTETNAAVALEVGR